MIYWTPLVVAVGLGGRPPNMPELERLLADPATDVNEVCRTGTALMLACCHHKTEVVEMLLNAGANPNADDPPLLEAICHGDVDIIALLLAHGADVNCDGYTALASASARGETHLPTVQLLINSGADVNKFGRRGLTALHEAASSTRDCPQILELLISCDAYVNARKMPTLQTPLHVAARAENKRNIEILLASNADPNLIDNKGNSALHYVGARKHRFWHEGAVFDLLKNAEIVRTLVAAGAHVFLDNKDNHTPLHAFHSRMNENADAVEVLAEYPDVVALTKFVCIPSERGNWEHLPPFCRGLEHALVGVYMDDPQGLPELFARLAPETQEFIQTVLLVFRGRLPEALKMRVLAEILD